MPRSTLIGVCLASSLIAAGSWAAPPAAGESAAASGPAARTTLDIICHDAGFEKQARSSHGLKSLIGPQATAAQRRSAIRLLFAAEHYRLRDGLTDYE